ncbi:DUF3383 family protein [Geomicrobium sp. JCM 19055]|uniref:DUF3383 family protein n=1 Tax=Geomicrobium sp. JCM 19055 TaxID=1460649 RepID=UPI00045ED1DD|nr:DUF3383 family protein [Geomicrobium sp. JCM 19055]GAK01507.1 putative bacteriophage protein [Geomicrobium sp. JCM 19055]
MAIRDVEVTITRETQTVSQAGFGLPLILGKSKSHEYKTYRSIQEVSDDFNVNDEEYRFANRIFAQSPRPQRVAIKSIADENEDGDGASPDQLVRALNNTDEDFYFLLCTDQSDDVVSALSDWVDSQRKLYFYTTNSIDSILDRNAERAVGLLHSDPTAAAGWVGRCAPTDPGSITWKFKQVSGVGLSEGINDDEIELIIDDESNGNAIISQGGVLHTTPGRTTSGEFIDILRSQDFVEARLKERVFTTLVNAPKVPFTNTGIAMIRAAVESVLKSAFNNGIIAEDENGEPLYNISTPDRSDVPQEDRAKRTLPDVNFDFELAGAIHGVAIIGAIRV